MHFTVGLDDTRLVSAGSDGNDSAKAGCQGRSDLSKGPLLPPFSLCPFFQRPGSNRSRGFAQGFFPSLRFLLSLIFVVRSSLSLSLSKGGVVNSFGLHRVQWIEIKSSGGLATHNDIVDGPVGCHNIVPRLAAIP